VNRTLRNALATSVAASKKSSLIMSYTFFTVIWIGNWLSSFYAPYI
jgi:hypothetical protein